MASTILVWLRNDLRIADNPALNAALARGGKVRAVYVHETDGALRARGGASRWWLHRSLNGLAAELAGIGVTLLVREGHAEGEILREVRDFKADGVFWNRRYGPAERDIDGAIKARLKRDGLEAESFAGNVLVEPFEIATKSGTPYAVYTPFWNALKTANIATPVTRPHGEAIASHKIDANYQTPDWAKKLAPLWEIGERAAHERLMAFLDEQVGDYPEGRDIPAQDATSRLSPHLAFGEISVRQIWHTAQAAAQHAPAKAGAIEKFLSELGWRDFNTHQLYHRADIASEAMQPKFAGVKWRTSEDEELAWQYGQTGFPIVDAGMRELWDTGFMQNRVRMLVASLFAKNMLLDWRRGERWFWDCLLDADAANNPGNWQWVAGSGLDAAPFFRIFNPVVQGERFDPEGSYVRRFVPELATLPDKWIHRPFEAPEDVLAKAGVTLGETYPRPIVDLKMSRNRALDAFKVL